MALRLHPSFRRSIWYGYSRACSSQVSLKSSLSRGPSSAEALEYETSYAVKHIAVQDVTREERQQERERFFKHSLDDVTVVRSPQQVASILEILTSEQLRDEFHSWDTETTDIDPRIESPVGKGKVICATAYVGDNVDFGNGPKLFVDNLDDAEGTLDCFKSYFEDGRYKKVWHNYAFDKHVLRNHGIKVRGFGGDTMHMARLVDTSRASYSLKSLCETYLKEDLRKHDMKEMFGSPRLLKSGEESKEIVVPPTTTLQRSFKYAADWVRYSTLDAKLTFELRETLHNLLEQMKILGTNASIKDRCLDLYELYCTYFLDYAELLTEMEDIGMCIDTSRLRRAQAHANADRELLEKKFRDWACTFSPEAIFMNINSDKQKQHILFSPCTNTKTKETLPREKKFKLDRSVYPGNHSNEKNNKAEAKREITLVGRGLKSETRTAGGWPSVSATSLKRLAGNPRANPPVYGLAEDSEACSAIDALMEASAVSTLLSSFIEPLQEWPDENGRIHASLNLNTETGRLSSRRPNLQNQPALEKDRYRIRDAFVAAPGNTLIVADYGQLELRLLAHITNCKSMLDAFEAGGDFHSRTAATMYSEIPEALERGDCVLEGDDSGNLPLVKDMFATERRRAKTLNFSIAYGKTEAGLAKDWGITKEEAKKALELWYKERKEVRLWQSECRREAWRTGWVETITGRRRYLPDIRSKDSKKKFHAQRAAINAPIQGSAADVVMAAMLGLRKDELLNALGWMIVLQVHDEVILEGPQWSADIALPRVKEIMQNPRGIHLRVDLDVDPRIAESWYSAK